MDDLFQNRYRIQTARAEWHGYDGGIYFVTICTAGREHYFGEIETEQEPFMRLSPVGSFANQLIANVTAFYPHVEIPLFVIMPNHIHAIIYIDGEAIAVTNAKDAMNVGNDGDAMKGGNNGDAMNVGNDGDAMNVGNDGDAMNVGNDGDAMNVGNDGDAMNVGNDGDAMNRVSTGGVTGKHNPMVTNCLGTVVRGLKARITRWANQNDIPFGWQARFYDRVVRNQNELNNIAEYIENNVVNWHLDEINLP